ncbi:replication initiation protein [Variovorax sp. RA8]|uniref:replication initiation protein n=1 Tax=Variovorax sp. (strain JCM 16519 / RA8) TaxID=662548 RepID=UPI000A9AB5B6|nr:replication initiation protein [Variovorax sp. RA8]VTU45006.1 Initiator Replication protein [Variovorax sp. RA8]
MEASPPNGKAVQEQQRFRKANEMVGMRAKKGRITLVTWKIHQALVYHAQQQHMQRLRDASKGRPMQTGSFSMPLSELVASAHYGSNGLELFKDYIREMQTTLIEWNSDETSKAYWTSSQILGTVEIKELGPPHPTILTWNFPDVVRDYVLDPKQYTRMMVELNENVRSLGGAVLAEIGLRYLTSPGGLTHREDVAWWIAALTGRGDREMEYRYFKRDVLMPSLKEVDDIQDEFTLELIEHRHGRRVEELQLRVHRKAQGSLGVNEPRNIFDLELLARIRAFGFREPEAGQIYVQNDEGLLRRTTDLVEERMRNAALPKIESPAAFFRDALKKGYANSNAALGHADNGSKVPSVGSDSPAPAPERKASPSVRKSRSDLVADWVRALAREAEAVYRTKLTPVRQAELRQQFEEEEVPRMLPAIARAWAEQGVESKSAKHTFFKWLATREHYEEPTADQLLEFSLGGELPDGALRLE